MFSMSPLRLTMFLLSILASISAICVFLWAIPCDLATCSAHRWDDGNLTYLDH